MQLHDLLKCLPKGRFSWYIHEHKIDKKTIHFSHSELQAVLNKAVQSIQNNKIGNAIDYVFLSIWLDKAESLKEFRKAKIFSLFSYLNSANHIVPISSFIVDNSIDLALDEDDLRFFKSIRNLSTLHPIIKRKRLSILTQIRKRNHILLKSLYSYVDEIFQRSWNKEPNWSVDTPNLFNPEEIIEAISYIIIEYRSIYKITDWNIVESDSSFILGEVIEELLVDACHIKLVQEYEILIDSLGYICEMKDKKITMKPPSPEFEKAWRMGNILLDMNRMGALFYHKDAPSIVEFAKDFNKATDNFILHWDSDAKRYVIALREVDYYQIYRKEFLLFEGLFREEMDFLDEVMDLLLLPYDKLKEFEIVTDFNFYDLLIVKRIFTFISLAYFSLLREKEKEHYHTSNIPFLSVKTLKKMLSPAIGENKTEIFINTYCFSNEYEGVFDIQYTPLLKGEEHYLIPLNIIMNSNLFRNILFPLGKRLYGSGVDPIADILTKALRDKEFIVKSGFKYKYKGQQSDIDVIAIHGNNVFIFECKNSVLPVNAFELRGSFKELRKAAEKQLPLAFSACSDKNFLKKNGFNLLDENAPVNIYATVVTTYKLFSGYSINGFPIRNVKNLKTFIETGEVGLAGGDDKAGNGIYSMWHGDTFNVNDLIEYLKPATKLYNAFFSSMFSTERWNTMDYIDVYEIFYELNWDKLADNLDKLNLKKIKDMSID